jgi:photosystem II stability/assembly factor-like uncharacterized protein
MLLPEQNMKTLPICFLLLLATLALAAPPTQPSPEKPTWQPLGLSGGGAMFNPVISPADPQTAILHCDMSAAYLTHDAGKSWHIIPTDQLRSNTQCAPAFHPTDKNILYSPSGDKTLKVSHDAGQTWQPLHTFDQPLTGPIAINPHNPNEIILGSGEETYRSTDAGKTFQPLAQLTGHFLAAHFPDASTFFVATDKDIRHWAKSFSSITDGLPDKTIRSFTGATDPHNATTLYCIIPGKNDNGHYTGGIYTWNNAQSKWQPAGTTGLTLDTKKFDQWARNDITQFEQITTSSQHPEIVYASNTGTGIPVPHHATIYRSSDAGKTWHQTFFPDPRYPNFNVEKDYFVVEDGQFYQNLPQLALDPHNPDHLLTIVGGKAYTTTNAGKSWQCSHAHAAGEPKPGVPWQNTGLVVTTTWHYYIDPHDPNRHYICYTDIGLARSTDAGKTWIWWNTKNSSPWRNTCYELAFDPDIPGKIYGAFSDTHDIPNGNIIYGNHRPDRPGGICLSTDFGQTWTPLQTGLPKLPPTSIILDPNSPKNNRTLYAAFFGSAEGGIYKSTDDGHSWTPKNTNLGSKQNLRACRVQLHPDGTLFALITANRKNDIFQAEGPGLYKSTDHADSWTNITQSLPACLWPKDFTLDPANSKILYLGLADANGQQTGGLYRTTNSGKSWTRILRAGPQHFGAYLSPHHKNWIYATLTEAAPSYGLYISKDNGQTFTPLKDCPFDNIQRIEFDPNNPNIIYATTFGASIWKAPAD